MLNNWENINKMGRKAFEEQEASPPAGMFGNIQKKLFWSNFGLFLKAYSLHIFLISCGLASVSFILFVTLHTNNSSHLISQPAQKEVLPNNNNNTNAAEYKENSPQNTPLNQTQNTSIKIKITDIEANTPRLKSQNLNIANPGKINSKLKTGQFPEADSKSTENTSQISQNTLITQPKNLVNVISSNSSPVEKPEIHQQNKESRNQEHLIATNENQSDLYSFDHLASISFILPKTIAGITNNENLSISRNISHLTDDYYSKKKHLDFTLKIYGGPSFAAGTRIDAPEVNNSESSSLKLNSNYTLSGTAGLAFDVIFKRIHFQVGAQFTELQLSYSGNNLLYNSRIDTHTVITGWNPNINIHNYYIHNYRLDSIIHTDSVYTTELDTVYTPVYALTHKQHYDTLHQSTWKETFHIIEVPFTVGYSLNLKNWEFSLNAGLILGYITGTRYQTYAGTESLTPLVPVKNFYSYKAFQLSGLIALSGTCWMGRHVGLEISPYYRRSLIKINSADKRSALNYSIFGVNLGVIYKF